MTIRIRFWHLVLVGVPVVLILVSLLVHDHYWSSTGEEIGLGGVVLGVTGVLVAGFAATYTELLHDHLSRSYWSRFQYVQSSPAQATAALWLGRVVCVVLLWSFGILGILGRLH